MATSRSLGSSSLTTRPSIAIWPEVMSSRPALMQSNVLLPHPDGPTKTTNSWSATSRSTPCTTATSPYDLQTPRRLTPATASVSGHSRSRQDPAGRILVVLAHLSSPPGCLRGPPDHSTHPPDRRPPRNRELA